MPILKGLSASSLLEVLVAGALLCLISSISVSIFVNVSSSAPSLRDHHLDVVLQTHLNNIRKKMLTQGVTIDTISNEVILLETIEKVKDNKYLFVINLELIDTHGNIEARTTALQYQYDEQTP